MKNFSSTSYDLNSFNCTYVAIQSASNGGISLPDTTGTWGNFFIGTGAGSNPGDLGEDIRQLANPSSPNYNPSVVVNTNSGNGPPSKGPCN